MGKIETANKMLGETKTIHDLIDLLEYCEENHLDIVTSRKDFGRFVEIGMTTFEYDVYRGNLNKVYFLIDNEYDKKDCAIYNLRKWTKIAERTYGFGWSGKQNLYGSDVEFLRKIAGDKK